MPPNTTTDIAKRLSAPAPELRISGIAPSSVDRVVIITGLNLIKDDSITACDFFIPSAINWFANSTTSIPFLAIRPINIKKPI